MKDTKEEPVENPTVYHFESKQDHLFLALPDGKNNVEFIGKTFITDDGKTAEQIRLTKSYGRSIFEVEGVIAQPKKKFVVHSGARPADTK
jgi:hypothetical protein